MRDSASSRTGCFNVKVRCWTAGITYDRCVLRSKCAAHSATCCSTIDIMQQSKHVQHRKSRSIRRARAAGSTAGASPPRHPTPPTLARSRHQQPGCCVSDGVGTASSIRQRCRADQECAQSSQPTATRAFLKSRSHGPSSPHSSGCHEFVMVRNTRSGCGIRISARPSSLVSPAIPSTEPLGLSG